MKILGLQEVKQKNHTAAARPLATCDKINMTNKRSRDWSILVWTNASDSIHVANSFSHKSQKSLEHMEA